MPWDKVENTRQNQIVILAAGDCKSPTRIRLVAGPGPVYSEPFQIHQHWGPQDAKFPPAACGDPLGKNCIFHAEPYSWRTNKINVVHAIVYPPANKTDEQPAIKIFQGPTSLFTQFLQQANMVGADPLSVDWIVQRTGEGKEGTKYTATMAPGMPIHHGAIDLAQWPMQDETIRHSQIPQLVDYDKIDGYRVMSPVEQELWIDKIFDNKAKKEGAAAAPTAPKTPSAVSPSLPAPPLTASMPSVPVAAPVAPPAVPVAPPAPPAGPTPLELAKALASPWPEKGTMGQIGPETIKWMIENEAQFGPYAPAIAAAKIIAAGGIGTPTAPPAVPVATAPTGDITAAKARVTELMQRTPTLTELPACRAFFKKMTGVTALGKMTLEQLNACIAIAEQGDAAVQAFLA